MDKSMIISWHKYYEKSCANPIFLYMAARSYYKYYYEKKLSIYDNYRFFIEATVKGKFSAEASDRGASSIGRLSSLYKKFLLDVAVTIAQKTAIRIDSEIDQELLLDNNKVRYFVEGPVLDDITSQFFVGCDFERHLDPRFDKTRKEKLITCYFFDYTPTDKRISF